MKRPTPALGIILLILLSTVIPEAHAHELSIETNKAVYRPGDTIIITANIKNTKEETVHIAVETVLRDLRSKFSPHMLLQELTLSPEEAKQIELLTLPVDDKFYSGTYTVHVSLIEGRFRAREEEIHFQVEGAPEDMQLEILLSKDPAYTEQTRIFIKNEKIYLGFKSSVQDISIAADLTLPDNSSKHLTLPTNITAKQAGAYTLSIQAKAEGYRDLALTEHFAVLDKEPQLVQAEKKPSSISLSISEKEITQGETIEAHGAMTPPHADAIITLTQRKDGQTLTTRTVTADDEGRFHDTFKPETSGDWTITASWQGDTNHEGAQSQEIPYKVTTTIPLTLLLAIAAIAICAAALAAILKKRRRPSSTSLPNL